MLFGVASCRKSTIIIKDTNTSNNINLQSTADNKIELPEGYPFYSTNTVEEMIEWIKTVDAGSFQDGRYEEFINQLRADGEITIPIYYKSININTIYIVPQAKYEEYGFIYRCTLGDKDYVISIYYIFDKYLSSANKSMSEYNKERFGIETKLTPNQSEKLNIYDTSVNAFLFDNLSEKTTQVQFILNKSYIIMSIYTPNVEDVMKDLKFEKVKIYK